MIPISLKLKGIFSYQEEQTIDFETLLTDDIFGIFGSVGSGKSAILDAMTYVLYKKVARMKNDHIINNIMNLKSNEIKIEFVFATDNQSRYKATISARRQRANPTETYSPKHLLYKWNQDSEDWQPCKENIEDIIGLSQENFMRTVIIPQGKFSEFLQLGATDRSKMLKDIFGLHKYDLYSQTAALQKDTKSRIDSITGELKGLGEADPQTLESKKEELNKLEPQIQEIRKKLSASQAHQNSLLQIQEKAEQLQLYQKQQIELQSQKPDIEELAVRLKRFEEAQKYFKAYLDSKHEKRQKYTELQTRIQNGEHKIKENEALLRKLHKEEQALKKQQQNIPALEKTASDLQKLIQLKQIHTTKQQLIVKKQQLQAKLEEKEQQYKSLKNRLETQEQRKEQLENFIRRETEWTRQKEFLTQRRDLNQINEECRQKSKDILDIGEESDPNKVLQSIQTLKAKSEAELKKVQAHEKELAVQLRLVEFASELSEGKPCPLCGATHHPQPLTTQNIQASYIEVQQSVQSIETLLVQFSTWEQEFSRLSIQTEMARKKLNQLQSELSNPQLDGLSFEEIEENLKTAKKYRQELKTIANDLKNSKKTLESWQSETETLKSQLINLQNELSKQEGAESSIRENMDPQILARIAEPQEEILAEQNRIKTAITEIHKQEQTFQQDFNKAKKDQGLFEGLLNTLRDEAISLDKELDTLQQKLSENLNGHGFKNEDEIQNILNSNIDTNTAQKTIQSFREQEIKTQTALENLKKEIGNQHFEPKELEEIQHQIKTLDNQQQEYSQKIGEIEEQIKTLTSKLEQKKSLKTELKLAQKRGDLLTELGRLFKRQGFVEFIASEYLKNLVKAASKRFHVLTKQSLELRLNENNEIEVVDLLNDGKRRSVKTLSGGQTFQVSLSLALALAGSVRSLNKNQGSFFFLDEGFGTQDEESLKLVFETIHSLRKEKRKVGLISHVEALKEEVSTYLQVTNHPETGSQISASWK